MLLQAGIALLIIVTTLANTAKASTQVLAIQQDVCKPLAPIPLKT
jgi:hypothetical protein